MSEYDSTSQSEIAECKNCALRIYKEVGMYIVCHGPCNSAFHISCVGIDREQLQAISRGIIWLCNSCMPAYREWKTAQMNSTSLDTSSIVQNISDLKLQVSKIADALEKITPNGTSSPEMFKRHSTPVTSFKLNNGSRCYDSIGREEHAQTEPVTDQDSELVKTNDDNRCFSLLLTNIDSAVSESDIKAMVCRCLDAPVEECEGVIKLVPKGVNYRLLDFVSFKIVLKWKWKSLSLRESTWPDGVQFREFFNRKCSTWKP